MVSYCTIWYHIVQYGIILYNMVSYCTIWYHIVQYGIILYNMVSYCTIWYHLFFVVFCFSQTTTRDLRVRSSLRHKTLGNIHSRGDDVGTAKAMRKHQHKLHTTTMAATPAALWSQRNKGENTTLEATSAAAKKEESAGGARQDALVAPHRRGERRGERRRRGGEEERREGAKQSHLQKARLERPSQEAAGRSTVTIATKRRDGRRCTTKAVGSVCQHTRHFQSRQG